MVKTIATLPSVLYVIFFKNDIGNPSINIGKFLKISDNLTLNIQAFFCCCEWYTSKTHEAMGSDKSRTIETPMVLA